MKTEPQAKPKAPTSTKQQKPFRIFNFTFASKRTFVEFMLTSILIIVVPVLSVLILNSKVKDDPSISELMKVVIAVGPAVAFINIVMCAYAVRAMRDPINYQVDPPLKIKLKPN